MKQNRTVLEAKRYGIHSCQATDSLLEVARRMVEQDISALVVTDRRGSLTGIITRTDLLRACMANEDWDAKPVASFMSASVVTVTPQTLLRDVARLLLDNHIHRVVVVRAEDGLQIPVAVLSDGDFVYHMVREAEE